jgi:hypothetical protein
MNVFEFRNRVISDYSAYIKSFISIRDKRIRQRVEADLEGGLLRCETDAAFFLYQPATPDGQLKPASKADGAVHDETPEELADLKKHFPTPRDAVAYIMDTFPIVRRKDEDKYGEYRTKRIILEIYDAMADAIRTGKSYQTRLNPPPADPHCCHPPKEE